MACGVGTRFCCVTPVRTAGGWDYRRVCVEGPVFGASCLAWDGPGEVGPE
jgi:dihydroorotate dehydrogenase electron transfer subunit